MEFFFRSKNGDGCPMDRIIGQGVQMCPFLKNITEPTNFSFSSAKTFPPQTQAKAARGPIFEDGPDFDTAFKLFHGRDGVVPLSGRSTSSTKADISPEPDKLAFQPLAASAATISLSAFGSSGPFSFDSFIGKRDKNKKKQGSSGYNKFKASNEAKSHEASGIEWLETGKCPIAKSYQAVSKVLPLVANMWKLPPGMKYKCPPAIVAARAAIARTALAKSLRPKPLPAKLLAIGLLGMAANVPLGVWRAHTTKFSPSWFIAIHAAIPFVAMLRKAVNMPKSAMVFTFAAAILGQMIGARAEKARLIHLTHVTCTMQQQLETSKADTKASIPGTHQNFEVLTEDAKSMLPEAVFVIKDQKDKAGHYADKMLDFLEKTHPSSDIIRAY